MKYYKNKQVDLKCRYETLKEATDKRIKYRFILKWIRQYDVEWSIKELTYKREMNIKSACFIEIVKQHNTKRFEKSMLLNKAFKALAQYSNRTQIKKSRRAIADNFHFHNLKQRAIHAFRYNLVTTKSINLMETKRNDYYLIRGFESFKWNWEIKRSQIEFNSIIEHREMKDHFYAWFETYQTNKIKREKLKSILDTKHYYDTLESFGIWKKDTFFRTMVNLIDEFVQQPNDTYLVQDVFYAWRRTHEFGKVKEN